MPKTVKGVIALLAAILPLSVSASVVSLPLTIDGFTHHAELMENRELKDKISTQVKQDLGRHYSGSIASVDGSWLRVSNIDNRWQGVASVYGELFIVDQPVDLAFSAAQATTATVAALPVTDFAEELGSCASGVSTLNALVNEAPLANAFGAASVAEPVQFSSFCAAQVDGICILAEIEFAFDLAFQSLFAGQAAAQAAALINIAEGYYLNDLNMGFDVITMEFMSSDLFSPTTNALSLLGDIQSKKSASQIPFVKNSRALFHLVTGRDFDGSTAGIAYVDGICDNAGFSSGTTSVVGSGANQIPLTALIVAHELGHNFGAFHDGDLNDAFAASCPSGVHIMSTAVSSAFTNFSSCSIQAFQNDIDTQAPNPNLCFNFPANVSMTASGGNPTTANSNTTFSTGYSVAVTSGFQVVNQLRISGTVNVGGRFSNVTANGLACAISANQGHENTAYSCTVNNPGSSVALAMDIFATGWDAQVLLTHGVTVLSADVVDLMDNDNSVNEVVAVMGELTEAPPLVPTVSGDSGASNNASGSGGGGGGGGSIDGFLLALCGLLLGRRFRLRARR